MMGSAYGSLPLCLNTFIVMLLLVANKLSLSVCLSLSLSLSTVLHLFFMTDRHTPGFY